MILAMKGNLNILSLIIAILLQSPILFAQKRVVDQVKQDLNNMSLSIDSYKNAISNIAPALQDEETKNDAEAWYIAGIANFRLYDKCMQLKTIGQSDIDENLMYSSLLIGYDNFQQALKLDSVVVKDKKGNIKYDKNNKPKIETKFSKKIIKILYEHFNDFRIGGGIFYVKQNNYANAYKAWDIYTTMPYAGYYKRNKFAINDSIIGKYCYMKGIAAKMNEDNAKALEAFLDAIEIGYNKKDVFDFAINCAEIEKNEELLVSLVKQAYAEYGKDDSRYITFMLNYAIANKHYDDATKIIDMAIAEYPNNAEYYDLKGVLVENQSGDIDNAYIYFKKCLEIDPNHIRGNFDMGRYYYNKALKAEEAGLLSDEEIKSLFRDALPYLEKSYKYNPQNTAIVDALKSIYYHLNDAEKLDALENGN